MIKGSCRPKCSQFNNPRRKDIVYPNLPAQVPDLMLNGRPQTRYHPDPTSLSRGRLIGQFQSHIHQVGVMLLSPFGIFQQSSQLPPNFFPGRKEPSDQSVHFNSCLLSGLNNKNDFQESFQTKSRVGGWEKKFTFN